MSSVSAPVALSGHPNSGIHCLFLIAGILLAHSSVIFFDNCALQHSTDFWENDPQQRSRELGWDTEYSLVHSGNTNWWVTARLCHSYCLSPGDMCFLYCQDDVPQTGHLLQQGFIILQFWWLEGWDHGWQGWCPLALRKPLLLACSLSHRRYGHFHVHWNPCKHLSPISSSSPLFKRRMPMP